MSEFGGTNHGRWRRDLREPTGKRQLNSLLPLFGHRNWIVVADSAYPAQSKPGIETIVSGAGQVEVARRVLDAIDGQRACSRQYLSRPGTAICRRGRRAGCCALSKTARRTAQDLPKPSPCRTSRSSPNSTRSRRLSRAHYQDGTDNSVHLDFLRARLRLLECGRGRAASRFDGDIRRKIECAIAVDFDLELNTFARTNARKEACK